MEREASRPVEKRRRTRCVLCVAVVLLVIIVVVVAVGLAYREGSDKLKPTFIARCEAFKG